MRIGRGSKRFRLLELEKKLDDTTLHNTKILQITGQHRTFTLPLLLIPESKS